jgi:hypothetical protein
MRAAHFDSRRPVPQAGFPAERRPSLEAHSPLRGLDLPGPRLPRSAKSPDSARDQTNQCPSGSRPSRGPIEQGSGHHQGCRGHDGRARVDSGRLDPDARRRSVRGTATATATRSRASSARCCGPATDRCPEPAPEPRVGRSKPIQVLISVDFPAPFGPTSAVIDPSGMSRSKPLTARSRFLYGLGQSPRRQGRHVARSDHRRFPS